MASGRQQAQGILAAAPTEGAPARRERMAPLTRCTHAMVREKMTDSVDDLSPSHNPKIAQSSPITKADVISRGGIAVVVRVLAEVLIDADERCIGTLRSSA